MNKSYSELVLLDSFLERFEYLKLDGSIGHRTLGGNRYLSQTIYRSYEWRKLRDRIILRDCGCDLAMEGYDLNHKVYIHHINPITEDDLKHCCDSIFDPDNLVCVSGITHNAIHYGDSELLITEPIIRRPNDTCPWKETL